MMKNIGIAITVSLLSGLCMAKEPSLPKGWRLPVASETTDKWRTEQTNRFTVVEGDFDGDKRQDKAMLLVKSDGKGFGLFVWLAKSRKPIPLVEEKESSLFAGMGIRLVKPSTVKTACGKGYGDCEPAVPKELVLTADAIDYFKTESANSYFKWNSKKRSFDRVWISD